MTNNKNSKKYDLEERTAKFGEDIIGFVRKLPKNGITQRIIPQLVGAGTAVGSNYCEADCAESNKDFIHKMAIANKEAKESKHFYVWHQKLAQNMQIKRDYYGRRRMNLI